jgi:dihydrolipoamide dehydrogenase
MTHDLLIIGGGPAGYHAAILAGQAGLSVVLFEKREIGGVCLNEGCIPAKSLLHSARLLDAARQGARHGVLADNIRIDHARVLERTKKVIKTLKLGIMTKLREARVSVIGAEARFSGRNDNGFLVRAGETVWCGKNAFIASGSRSLLPDWPGLEEGMAAGRIVTSSGLLERSLIPEDLVVVGGGAIGLEFASYYRSAGSRVTVIEMLETIGGGLDAETSAFLRQSLERRGIAFRMSATVTECKKNGVAFHSGSGVETVSADSVLVSVGREAAGTDLGLETIGLETMRGAVLTDDACRTSIPGLYAAGDVNGRSLFAHTAYREAETAVATILGQAARVNYDLIPGVIYTDPEAAFVGDNITSARTKGIACMAATVSLRSSGRFLIENEGGDGLFVMFVERSSGRLVGAQAVGNPVSELIFGASLMIERRLTAADIARSVFPHPTVSEIYREAARRLI